jgi:thioredoxin reductase (NADPH)
MRPAHEAGAQLDDTDLVRLRAYGTSHPVECGDILFAPGQPNENFVVIESGTVDVERPATPDAPAALLSNHGAGQFLGELNLLTGQTSFLTARVSQAGVVTLIDKDAFARLMREEARLSDRILRMFVARRAYMRSGEGARSVEILGSRWCSESSALRTWAARQQVPHLWLDVDTAKGAALASAVQAGSLDLPVVIALGRIERNATPTSLAAMLGLQADHRGDTSVRDVVIIGGGPAGLAAALCSASEGLDTLLLEGKNIGGQAAASARIENYVGFPSGISGGELTSRALIQAHKFGAQVSNPCVVTGLSSMDGDLSVELETGSRVLTRCVVIATGAHYNTLPLDGWTQYENTSIFYAATELEARACSGGPVVVVGGANSAGQAAIFMAESGSRVTLVLRGSDLEARMSRYLAGRVRAHPDITLRTETAVVALHGNWSLGAVDLQDANGVETLPCVGLFCFIGASPVTDYVGEVARDAHGFLRTDRDLQTRDLSAIWQLMGRQPLPYETSIPGVLAVGDVRAGSVKRVAAAVGEGSAAVASVHRLLASSGHALNRAESA